MIVDTENKNLLDICHSGLNVVMEKGADGAVRLLHFSSLPYSEEAIPQKESARKRYTLVEVHCSGESQHDHHGAKHTGSNPGGGVPQYVRHSDVCNRLGRKVEVVQAAAGLEITSHFQFIENMPVVRSWTDVSNVGAEPVGLEYVSSFALAGIAKSPSSDSMGNKFMHLPHNAWKQEFQWRRYALSDLGLVALSDSKFTTKRISVSNTGSWAAKEFLPEAVLECGETGEFLFWQIESHASWHWELGDIVDSLYLQLSGPTERESQWWKNLQPGETFSSIPVAVGITGESLGGAFGHLNAYRRAIRRPNPDNEKLPVVFNDYMNCLMADPSTQKLLPLIEKAAAAGAEYFVIDGGWYDDGSWWGGVGEWLPSRGRFPGGIEEPLDHIRANGMVPGIWLELERMGMNCRLASEWPEECFFIRHGKRVIDHESYQLDFRHPVVVAHADEVVRRVVEGYGVGFIKMDYNLEIGPGTEVDADSFGEGLLQHQRAYRTWLEKTFARYPGLVIENCSSGGLRLTGGLMDLHSTSSTTDNQDYLTNARISINCATGVCPEQAGIWAYPLADADEEEVIMNMVSALSWRIYLSGQMQTMEGQRLELIKEAVAFYKTYRKRIPEALPVWPLGLAGHDCGWGAFALRWDDGILLSVWRFDSEKSSCSIPLPEWKGSDLKSECTYPKSRPVIGVWDAKSGRFEVELPSLNSARMFFLTPRR